MPGNKWLTKAGVGKDLSCLVGLRPIVVIQLVYEDVESVGKDLSCLVGLRLLGDTVPHRTAMHLVESEKT